MTIKERLYHIIDNHTKRVVSAPYKSRRRARLRADRLDLEYGAIKYQVKEIQ